MKVLWQAWQQNSVHDWALGGLLALAALLLLLLARLVAKTVARALTGHEKTVPLNRVIAAGLAATKTWLLLPVCLYAGASALDLPAKLDRVIDSSAVVALLLQAAWWISGLATFWLSGQIERRRGVDSEAVTALSLLEFGARTLVWTFVILAIVHHLGFNVSALVTGLGVGGVAVALAAQSILSDLFASLSIVLDKPFVIGDFIIIEDFMGTVEHVGVKTTRLRSLGGELIVFSNSDLLKSRIRNYKRMYERRVVFGIGVTYETGAEQLAQIPQMLRQAVLANDTVRFDRAHFKEYSDSALLFEVVYFVLSPDFNLYMDIQQAINLAVFEQFDAHGIAFAHPIRTLRYAAATAGPQPMRQSRPKGGYPWTEKAIA